MQPSSLMQMILSRILSEANGFKALTRQRKINYYDGKVGGRTAFCFLFFSRLRFQCCYPRKKFKKEIAWAAGVVT